MTERRRRLAVAIATHDQLSELVRCFDSLKDDPLVTNGDLMVWLLADGESDCGAGHVKIMQDAIGTVKYHEEHEYLGPIRHRHRVLDIFLREMDYEWVLLIDSSDVLTEKSLRYMQAFTLMFNGEQSLVGKVELRGASYNIMAIPGWFWTKLHGEINRERGLSDAVNTALVEHGLLGACYHEDEVIPLRDVVTTE